MKVLGIETSCDETSAAVVDGSSIQSNVIATQLDLHERFGGVVPELASRRHLETLVPTVRRALSDAGVGIDAIEGVAATCGPGLIGALLVGLNFGKSLAAARGVPFVGVNHLDGHLNAVFLAPDAPAYPFVALLVSGGHSHLYRARAFGEYELLGRTRDDAAGEAFDKAARLLGLPYPGGPEIDRLARDGDRSAFAFPRAMPGKPDLSFSGLKTAVLVQVRALSEADVEARKADLAASVQEAIVDALADKALAALERTGLKTLVVSGGVAANSRLREVLAERAAPKQIAVHFPPMALCTDNAAMIAYVGHERIRAGKASPLSTNASAQLPLEA